jgi:hypothetical protein
MKSLKSLLLFFFLFLGTFDIAQNAGVNGAVQPNSDNLSFEADGINLNNMQVYVHSPIKSKGGPIPVSYEWRLRRIAQSRLFLATFLSIAIPTHIRTWRRTRK